jgi:hypothetical protein
MTCSKSRAGADGSRRRAVWAVREPKAAWVKPRAATSVGRPGEGAGPGEARVEGPREGVAVGGSGAEAGERVETVGLFGGAEEAVFDGGIGAGVAGEVARGCAGEREGAAGGVELLVGELGGVVPEAEFGTGGAVFGRVDEFGDGEPTLAAAEAVVETVAGGGRIAGRGIEGVAVEEAEVPGGRRSERAGKTDTGGGDVKGGAGVDGVGGNEGGPAEGAVGKFAAGFGAGELFVGEQGAGAEGPAGAFGFKPPRVEARAVERLGVAGGEKIAEEAGGGAAALVVEDAGVGAEARGGWGGGGRFSTRRGRA